MVLTWTGRMQVEDALKDILESMDSFGHDENAGLTRGETETALLSITMRPIEEHAHLYVRALHDRLSTLKDSANTIPLEEEDAMYFANEISEVEQAIEDLSR